MTIHPIQRAILAGACGLGAVGVHAQALSWEPSAAFSGFGTVAYTQTDTRLALYAAPGQPSGATTEGSFGVDSKVGLQVNAKANSVFSATVQAISQRNGKGNFKPQLDWAFAKAQVMPELSLRVGRMGSPLFAVSDFRNIGYANLWVRPPVDVYGQVAFSHFDGADVNWQSSIGSVAVTAQALFGNTNYVSNGTRVHVRKQAGVNITAEFESGITLRFGRLQAKLTADNAALTHLVAVLGATPYAAVGNEISAQDKDASFTGVGLAYDRGNWVGGVEYTKRRVSSYVDSTTGWATTLGYRIDKFTPYAVVSKLKRDSTNVNDTIPTGVPQLAPLRAAVEGLVANAYTAQKTDALGLRWDAYKNLDVKAQIDHITPASGSRGFFNSPKPGFGAAVNVYTVAVDFVF